MINYCRALVAIIAAAFAGLAHGETIDQVINRSLAEHLSRLRNAELADVPKTVASFVKVRDHVDSNMLIMVKVVQGPHSELAFTDSRSVVIHAVVEHWSEIERQFVIAHEVGHIVLRHRQARLALYQKYYPGEVTKDAVEIVNKNPEFSREMMELSHRGEFEADVFAVKTLCAMGWKKDEVINAFLGMARTTTTATHPSSFKRAQNMRSVQVQE